MNNKTREALVKSIEKWRNIECHDGEDHGPFDCALCELFINAMCADCPVNADGSCEGCENTPFMDWSEASRKYRSSLVEGDSLDAISERSRIPKIAWTDELAALARTEREFLEGLL